MREVKLMVIDSFAKLPQPRDDNWPMTVHQCSQGRAGAGVAYDYACFTEQGVKVRERQVVNALRTSGGERGGPALDDGHLATADVVEFA